MPLIKFTREEIKKDELECSVCKEQFKENEEIKQMPCKHNFHNECLDPWLFDVILSLFFSMFYFFKHNSCPVCRFNLPLENQNLTNKNSE